MSLVVLNFLGVTLGILFVTVTYDDVDAWRVALMQMCIASYYWTIVVPLNSIMFSLLQISTTCQEDIHYNIELIPTFSTKRIFISNSSSVGQTSLTLSSSDIQLNEHYKAIVRVNGSTFSQHLELRKYICTCSSNA